MEKVIREGKVAVLYSPGFGAGWYSWNQDFPQILFHPKIVELVEQNRKEEITKDFLKDLLNTTEYICDLGASDLEIKWLDEGTHFDIDEYDGSESIVTFDDIKLVA